MYFLSQFANFGKQFLKAARNRSQYKSLRQVDVAVQLSTNGFHPWLGYIPLYIVVGDTKFFKSSLLNLTAIKNFFDCLC